MRIIPLSVLFVLSSLGAMAQSSFNVSSHSAVIQGNTYEYSIGEMALISTERNAKIIVTQGQLQPHYAVVAGSNDAGATALSEQFKVYPNPTENLLFIDWHQATDGRLGWALLDATGKTVLKQDLELKAGMQKISIDVKSLSAGSYYLLLHTDAQKENISFKITKLN